MILTAILGGVWVLLINRFSFANLIIGLLLGIAIAKLHCLETTNPFGTVTNIKARYERRLLRIFA